MDQILHVLIVIARIDVLLTIVNIAEIQIDWNITIALVSSFFHQYYA